MPTSFLFEHSFNIANNFLSWGAATSGSGGFQGINDPTQLHFVSNDAISTGDDEVVIAVAMFAGQTINVDVDFGNGGGDDPIDLRGFVIDSNGAFITQDDSGTLDPGSVSVFDPNFSFTATTSGVYFIALSHWVNNYNGDFQFENDGTDNLIGSQFNDWLGGTRFENRLEGGDGNDVLSGLNGDDTLIGGGGRDNLTGGSGEDVFVFNSLTDMGIGAMRDIITDFRHQIDTINLRGVDANSGVAGNQDFRFVGTSIFGGSAGELRVAVAGGNTVIKMDVNGDAVADAAIVLSGTPTVTAGDFLL